MFTSSSPRGSNVHASYLVQHLKSFTISPACIPLHTEDALRLLEKAASFEARQHCVYLESSAGSYDLVIRDIWNERQEVERFPVRCLRAPRSRVMLSADGRVNELFFFTIEAFSLPNNEPDMHEMHVFLVLNCTAKEMVEDMLAAGMKTNYTMFSIISPQGYVTACEQPSRFRQLEKTAEHQEDSEYWEFSTDLLNAECVLLNYCFDDIENDLQCIREKVQGKKGAGFTSFSKVLQNKVVSLDDEVRKDPVFKNVVTDFIQKIRFALILLSRMNGFLPEPKSPLLIGQLFNILNECIGQCRKSKRCRYYFPSTVNTPAFPQYTLDYLKAHLSEEHCNLLNLLGEGWTTPREKMSCQSVFIPRFKCGFDVVPGNYDPSLFQYTSPNFDPEPSRHYMQPLKLSDFARDLLQRKLSVAKVNKEFSGKNPGEICLCKGEFVEILQHHGEKYQVRAENGEEGICPGSLLSHIQRYTPDNSD